MNKVAAAQPLECLGDVPRAISVILTQSKKAAAEGASLICFPECYLQGYLVEANHVKRHAVALESEEFRTIAGQLRDLQATIVLGLIEQDKQGVFNTAVVLKNGSCLGRYRKVSLSPGEAKVFSPGTEYPVFEADGLKFGVNICSDLNYPECARRVAQQGARLLVCPCNNMMHQKSAIDWKHKHNEIRAQRCRETGVWLLSSDVAGRRDDKISFGPTAIIDPLGQVVVQARLEAPGFVTYELPPDADQLK